MNPSDQCWLQFPARLTHKRHTGAASYRFDERVNATDFFESQSYTSLMQVGPNEAFVTYVPLAAGNSVHTVYVVCHVPPRMHLQTV